MKKWFLRWFVCRIIGHDWDCVDPGFSLDPYGNVRIGQPLFRCERCGKEEGL